MMRAMIIALMLLPSLAGAQELLPNATPDDQIPQAEPARGLGDGTGAMLRGLDKVAGTTSNIEMKTGQTIKFGFISITLRECRYPIDDPSSDAYAFLTITEPAKPKPDFSGWMIASSPALSALDHPRYDVWVVRCTSN
jgi:hypothetical protein